jgi:hypothetical protein
VRKVPAVPGDEAVDDAHALAAPRQFLCKVRPDEARTTCDEI